MKVISNSFIRYIIELLSASKENNKENNKEFLLNLIEENKEPYVLSSKFNKTKNSNLGKIIQWEKSKIFF